MKFNKLIFVQKSGEQEFVATHKFRNKIVVRVSYVRVAKTMEIWEPLKLEIRFAKSLLPIRSIGKTEQFKEDEKFYYLDGLSVDETAKMLNIIEKF